MSGVCVSWENKVPFCLLNALPVSAVCAGQPCTERSFWINPLGCCGLGSPQDGLGPWRGLQASSMCSAARAKPVPAFWSLHLSPLSASQLGAGSSLWVNPLSRHGWCGPCYGIQHWWGLQVSGTCSAMRTKPLCTSWSLPPCPLYLPINCMQREASVLSCVVAAGRAALWLVCRNGRDSSLLAGASREERVTGTQRS